MPRDMFDEITERYTRRSSWDAVIPDTNVDDDEIVDEDDEIFDEDFSEVE